MRGMLWSIETGNLPELWNELQSNLTSRKAAKATIAKHRMHIGRLDQFMRAKGIDFYSPEVGSLFMTEDIPHDSPSAYENHRGTIKQLDMLFNQQKITAKGRDYQEIINLADFEPIFKSFCSSVKSNGVSEKKMYEYTHYGAEFLSFAINNGITTATDITPNLLANAFDQCGSKSAFTTVIRRFMKYLYEQQILKIDMTVLVPKERLAQPVPTTYNEDEISSLLTIPDRSKGNGKRDYAIIMTAWRLGFRAGDIAKLQFSNLDMKNNKIDFVQGKTDYPIHTELPPEVKSAIIDYVSNGRPDSESPFIFLSSRKDHSPITSSCITAIVGRAFRRANLIKPNKKHGPHTLRSSFASELVAEGVPYTTVHKALGQQKASNLSYYVRVDIERLRECALDVPAPSGLFEEWLEVQV